MLDPTLRLLWSGCQKLVHTPDAARPNAQRMAPAAGARR